MHEIHLKPQIIGYRKSGAPIWRGQGGSTAVDTPTPSLVDQARQMREGAKLEIKSILDKATAEKRGLNDAEKATFDQRMADLGTFDQRIADLIESEKREAAANQHVKETAGGDPENRGKAGATVTEPDIYRRDGKNGNSYFRDMANAQLFGDQSALDRLHRHSKVANEKRALGNTGGVGGSGGEFAPPSWLIEDWIPVVRAGRITANLFQHMDIPAGVSSVNLPKVSTGTTTAIQSTQNTALSQTDLTTTFVQTGFATIGGKEVVAQQLLDQTGIPFDRVILGDLAADYGLRVGQQVYTGAGTGTGTGAVVNGLGAATFGTTTTWTQASPTIAGFYGQGAKTIAAFLTARLAPPTCWLMHPRRWFWMAGATDPNQRPLILPQGAAFNPVATSADGGITPQGLVGYWLGLPVYIDPNIPINGGAGTNQDNVYLVKADDLWLLESEPKPEVFRETYADSVGVLFRMYGYVGTILNRYTASIAVITGTGLVTPVFAS